MPETFRKKLTNISVSVHTSTSHKSGRPSFRWQGVSKLCMRLTYCIEILNVPMYSALQIDVISWEIWMFRKWQREEWHVLKLVLPTILVRRFGMIGLTMRNVMSGLWVVLFMRWQLYGHLLEQIIWSNCMLKFKRVFMSLCLDSIRMIWEI